MNCPGCGRENTLYVNEEYVMEAGPAALVARLTPALGCSQCDLHIVGAFMAPSATVAYFVPTEVNDGQLDSQAAQGPSE